MLTEFFTLCEQQMHAKTDAQGGCPGTHFFNEWLRESQGVQIPHSIAECTDSRKNQLCSGSHIIGIRSYQYFVSQPTQRILEAPQVIQFVIDNCDHSTPLVDGI